MRFEIAAHERVLKAAQPPGRSNFRDILDRNFPLFERAGENPEPISDNTPAESDLTKDDDRRKRLTFNSLPVGSFRFTGHDRGMRRAGL